MTHTNHTHTKDNTFMLTYSGHKFYPWHPEESEICIDDIAHALSNICRFGGHSYRHFSVAEHSLGVEWLVRKYQSMCKGGNSVKSKKVRLFALMHDAAEAYLGDISTPIKQFIPEFKIMENKIQRAIEDRLCEGVKSKNDKEFIKNCDVESVVGEADSVMNYSCGMLAHFTPDGYGMSKQDENMYTRKWETFSNYGASSEFASFNDNINDAFAKTYYKLKLDITKNEAYRAGSLWGCK